MSAPSFNLSRDKVYYNQAQLDEHKIESQNKNCKLFVFLRGHKFYRLKTDKRFYKFIFNIFSALGLIKTEGSDYFKALETYTKKQFTNAINSHLGEKITTLGNQTRDLTGKYGEEVNKNEQLKAENSTLKERNQWLESTLTNQTTLLLEVNANVANLEKQYKFSATELEKTKAESKKALDLKEAIITNLYSDLDRSNYKELKKKNEDLENCKDRLRTFENKIDNLTHELEHTKKTVKSREEQLQKLSEDKDKYLTQYNEVNSRFQVFLTHSH